MEAEPTTADEFGDKHGDSRFDRARKLLIHW
jgi:hypothetical protein